MVKTQEVICFIILPMFLKIHNKHKMSETVQEAAENTVLYYFPEGGQYYHADPNCKAVNEKYLPLEGTFTYAELDDEPYRELQPCGICGAPSR